MNWLVFRLDEGLIATFSSKKQALSYVRERSMDENKRPDVERIEPGYYIYNSPIRNSFGVRRSYHLLLDNPALLDKHGWNKEKEMA